jgi:hypothetical protein
LNALHLPRVVSITPATSPIDISCCNSTIAPIDLATIAVITVVIIVMIIVVIIVIKINLSPRQLDIDLREHPKAAYLKKSSRSRKKLFSTLKKAAYQHCHDYQRSEHLDQKKTQ